jgi:hypothetical protein
MLAPETFEIKELPFLTGEGIITLLNQTINEKKDWRIGAPILLRFEQ